MIYICIKLTLAGEDTGPFDIYTNADNFASPVVQNVSKLQLLEGYVMQINEATTTVIRIASKGACENYFDVGYKHSSYTYLNVGYDEGECGTACVGSNGTISINGTVVYSWPYLDNLPQSGILNAQLYDEISISATLIQSNDEECSSLFPIMNVYIDDVLVANSNGSSLFNYSKILTTSTAEFKIQTTCQSI